jgi:hypothetical protein
MRLTPLAVLALTGCTCTFTADNGIKYHSHSNLFAPNVTVVELPDGTMHVLAGSSTIGQLAGPAAVAYAGHKVGEGLKESGDITEVSASATQSQDQGQTQIQLQGITKH